MVSLSVVLVVLAIVLSGFRIAQEYERGVVFRLGRYVGLRGPGLYWIVPLGVDRIKVNAVLWYRIVDAARSVIDVADAQGAVYQLALTGLRNIIGQHDLDDVLQERSKINDLLRESIAGSTSAWGLEVQRFEMKDVELPVAMQQVMAMQAEAIREKRARIIKAEAEFEASVKLSDAAAQMMVNPAALELRRMQMISEVVSTVLMWTGRTLAGALVAASLGLSAGDVAEANSSDTASTSPGMSPDTARIVDTARSRRRKSSAEDRQAAQRLIREGDRAYRQGAYGAAYTAYSNAYPNHPIAYAYVLSGDSRWRAILQVNARTNTEPHGCRLDNAHFAHDLSQDLAQHYRVGLALARQLADRSVASSLQRRAEASATCLQAVADDQERRPPAECVNLDSVRDCLGAPLLH